MRTQTEEEILAESKRTKKVGISLKNVRSSTEAFLRGQHLRVKRFFIETWTSKYTKLPRDASFCTSSEVGFFSVRPLRPSYVLGEKKLYFGLGLPTKYLLSTELIQSKMSVIYHLDQCFDLSILSTTKTYSSYHLMLLRG